MARRGLSRLAPKVAARLPANPGRQSSELMAAFRRIPALVSTMAILLVPALLAGAAGAATADDLAAAKAKLADARASAQSAAAAYADQESKVAATQNHIDELKDAIEKQKARAAVLKDIATQRALYAYTHKGDEVDLLVGSGRRGEGDPPDAADGAGQPDRRERDPQARRDQRRPQATAERAGAGGEAAGTGRRVARREEPQPPGRARRRAGGDERAAGEVRLPRSRPPTPNAPGSSRRRRPRCRPRSRSTRSAAAARAVRSSRAR